MIYCQWEIGRSQIVCLQLMEYENTGLKVLRATQIGSSSSMEIESEAACIFRQENVIIFSET